MDLTTMSNFRYRHDDFQTIVFQPSSEEVAVVVTYQGQIAKSIYPALGSCTPALFKGSTALHTMLRRSSFPQQAGIPQGLGEFFANAGNLR